MLGRRQFLQLCGASAVALPLGRVHAIGKSSRFRIGQLQLGTSWNPRPGALARLTWEVEKRTSIQVTPDAVPIDLSKAKLRDTPYLYLAGEREFPSPTPAQVQRLRRFLTYGGFLHIDSAEGVVGGAFDGSVRRLIDTLYPRPGKGLEVVSKDHVVFKSFYLITRPLGRLAISSVMEGVVRDGRLVVAYTQNDLGGAWSRDDFGNFHFQCLPGGERQREMAFRLGTNLVMYALCLDYKSDQVHVPFIMRRRRWRPEDGAEEL